METHGSSNSLGPLLDCPILFLIFNRPKTTQIAFERIRHARPRRLYIAADGPRSHKEDEEALCEETRQIVEQVDWPCEVRTLFRDHNLGCKLAVSSAISWFFEHEEEGIIMEDDCVADPSFFVFCSEMLEKYRHDSRVMQIGGNNFFYGWSRDEAYSYYFSRYAYIWGWATWRRAWKHFDLHLDQFDEVQQKGYLSDAFANQEAEEYFWHVIDITRQGILNSWGYRWQFALSIQGGLTAVPQKNLVKNIGFGGDSTHTGDSDSPLGNIAIEEINLPLKHPQFVLWDKKSDARYFQQYLAASPLQKVKEMIKKFIPSFMYKNKPQIKDPDAATPISFETEKI